MARAYTTLLRLVPFILVVTAKAASTITSKPHIVVLTDICNEPDDAESLTRFLLYANEFHVDGLIATTSTWQKSVTHAENIHQIIDAYGDVVDNLNSHVDPKNPYPTADQLRSKVRSGLNGYGMRAARETPLNEGAKLIVD